MTPLPLLGALALVACHGTGDNCFLEPSICGEAAFCSEGDAGFRCVPIDPDALVWEPANLTTYTSYPRRGSPEWEDYNGGEWAGWFEALPDKMSRAWVEEHNIVAFFGTDADAYRSHELKTLRLREPGTDHTIDAVVYDTCADSDCDGCCTENASANGGGGILIDLEKNTRQRFGYGGWDPVEWSCLDCDGPSQ